METKKRNVIRIIIEIFIIVLPVALKYINDYINIKNGSVITEKTNLINFLLIIFWILCWSGVSIFDWIINCKVLTKNQKGIAILFAVLSVIFAILTLIYYSKYLNTNLQAYNLKVEGINLAAIDSTSATSKILESAVFQANANYLKSIANMFMMLFFTSISIVNKNGKPIVDKDEPEQQDISN